MGVKAYLYCAKATLGKSASRVDDMRLQTAVGGSCCVGCVCPIGSIHLRATAAGVVQLAKPASTVVAKTQCGARRMLCFW